MTNCVSKHLCKEYANLSMLNVCLGTPIFGIQVPYETERKKGRGFCCNFSWNITLLVKMKFFKGIFVPRILAQCLLYVSVFVVDQNNTLQYQTKPNQRPCKYHSELSSVHLKVDASQIIVITMQLEVRESQRNWSILGAICIS